MTLTSEKNHEDAGYSEQSNTAWVPMPWRGQMVTMRQGPTEPDVFWGARKREMRTMLFS